MTASLGYIFIGTTFVCLSWKAVLACNTAIGFQAKQLHRLHTDVNNPWTRLMQVKYDPLPFFLHDLGLSSSGKTRIDGFVILSRTPWDLPHRSPTGLMCGYCHAGSLITQHLPYKHTILFISCHSLGSTWAMEPGGCGMLVTPTLGRPHFVVTLPTCTGMTILPHGFSTSYVYSQLTQASMCIVGSPMVGTVHRICSRVWIHHCVLAFFWELFYHFHSNT